ncbi:aldo/keto reductase [Candidatus Latescibacterota bacterium]
MAPSNRRDFLRYGVAAAAGTTFSRLTPRRTFAESPSTFKRIAFRELGSTGCKVSEVGFGAMNMRDPELLQAAIDQGINYIDTAWYYMKGVNEQVVGQVTKPIRDKVFITTKVLPPRPGDDISATMMAHMETSLKRLQTDYVDLMLLHAVSSRDIVLNNDYMGVLDTARKKGMCRFIGVSTHVNHAEILDAAVESKLWETVLTGYNYMSPPDVKPAIERARKAGLGIIAMKNFLNPIDLATWNWQTIPDIRESKDVPATPTQALLKWVLDDRHVDTTIPGVTNFGQLEENVAVMGMKMSFDERQSLERHGSLLRGRYCSGVAGCTDCLDECPHGVALNDLNRCLSYAYGYGDPGLAREQYALLPESSRIDRCTQCEDCTVTCSQGIDSNTVIRRAREFFGGRIV